MDFFAVWVLPICFFAIINCLFLAIAFLIKRPFKSNSDIIIAFLLIALSLRISKSIYYFLNPDISSFLISLGLMGKFAVGPLLYVFVKVTFTSRAFTIHDFLHFLLPLLVVLIGWNLEINYLTIGYWIGTLILSVYLLYSWYLFYSNYKNSNTHINFLAKSILIMVSLIWSTFVYQLFSGSMETYMVGTTLSGILLYWVNYALMSFSFKKQKRKSSYVISNEKKSNVANLIFKELYENKIYHDPRLTLSKLAQSVDQPVYVVSHVINDTFNKKFPELINHHRVEEVKEMLLDKTNTSLTIEALAYDVGFNTPSAFYTAFKKETGLTPQSFVKGALSNR